MQVSNVTAIAAVSTLSPLTPPLAGLPLLAIGPAGADVAGSSRRSLPLASMRDTLVALRRDLPDVRGLSQPGIKALEKIVTAVADAQRRCHLVTEFLLREPSFEPGGDLGDFPDYRQLVIRDAHLGRGAYAGSPARAEMLARIDAIQDCLTTLRDHVDEHVLIHSARDRPIVAAATQGDGRVALNRQLKALDPLAREALMIDLAQHACELEAAWQAVPAVMANATAVPADIAYARWRSNEITDGDAHFSHRLAAVAYAIDSGQQAPASALDDTTQARLFARYQSEPAFRLAMARHVTPISLTVTDIATQQAVSGPAMRTASRLLRVGAVADRVRLLFGLPSASEAARTAEVNVLRELQSGVASDDAVAVALAFMRARREWTWPVTVPLQDGTVARLPGRGHRPLGFARTDAGTFASYRRGKEHPDFTDALFDAMNAGQRGALGASSALDLRLQLHAYARTLSDRALAGVLLERSRSGVGGEHIIRAALG